jgi:hypothetical protein
MQHP